jgi:uncharacterized protein (DUF4415 family)
MVLSRELTEKDVRKLSHQLGINEDVIDKFKDQVDGIQESCATFLDTCLGEMI